MPSPEDVCRAYCDMAEQYIELFAGTAWMHADDLALIARHLSIRPGVVLDVGCGPGHLTAHLQSLDVDATGVWPADELAERLRRAGFTEVERLQRPGLDQPGKRPQAALAAIAG